MCKLQTGICSKKVFLEQNFLNFSHITMGLIGWAVTVNILYNPTTCSKISTRNLSHLKTVLWMIHVCSCLTVLHYYDSPVISHSTLDADACTVHHLLYTRLESIISDACTVHHLHYTRLESITAVRPGLLPKLKHSWSLTPTRVVHTYSTQNKIILPILHRSSLAMTHLTAAHTRN